MATGASALVGDIECVGQFGLIREHRVPGVLERRLFHVPLPVSLNRGRAITGATVRFEIMDDGEGDSQTAREWRMRTDRQSTVRATDMPLDKVLLALPRARVLEVVHPGTHVFRTFPNTQYSRIDHRAAGGPVVDDRCEMRHLADPEDMQLQPYGEATTAAHTDLRSRLKRFAVSTLRGDGQFAFDVVSDGVLLCGTGNAEKMYFTWVDMDPVFQDAILAFMNDRLHFQRFQDKDMRIEARPHADQQMPREIAATIAPGRRAVLCDNFTRMSIVSVTRGQTRVTLPGVESDNHGPVALPHPADGALSDASSAAAGYNAPSNRGSNTSSRASKRSSSGSARSVVSLCSSATAASPTAAVPCPCPGKINEPHVARLTFVTLDSDGTTRPEDALAVDESTNELYFAVACGAALHALQLPPAELDAMVRHALAAQPRSVYSHGRAVHEMLAPLAARVAGLGPNEEAEFPDAWSFATPARGHKGPALRAAIVVRCSTGAVSFGWVDAAKMQRFTWDDARAAEAAAPAPTPRRGRRRGQRPPTGGVKWLADFARKVAKAASKPIHSEWLATARPAARPTEDTDAALIWQWLCGVEAPPTAGGARPRERPSNDDGWGEVDDDDDTHPTQLRRLELRIRVRAERAAAAWLRGCQAHYFAPVTEPPSAVRVQALYAFPYEAAIDAALDNQTPPWLMEADVAAGAAAAPPGAYSVMGREGRERKQLTGSDGYQLIRYARKVRALLQMRSMGMASPDDQDSSAFFSELVSLQSERLRGGSPVFDRVFADMAFKYTMFSLAPQLEQFVERRMVAVAPDATAPPTVVAGWDRAPLTGGMRRYPAFVTQLLVLATTANTLVPPAAGTGVLATVASVSGDGEFVAALNANWQAACATARDNEKEDVARALLETPSVQLMRVTFLSKSRIEMSCALCSCSFGTEELAPLVCGKAMTYTCPQYIKPDGSRGPRETSENGGVAFRDLPLLDGGELSLTLHGPVWVVVGAVPDSGGRCPVRVLAIATERKWASRVRRADGADHLPLVTQPTAPAREVVRTHRNATVREHPATTNAEQVAQLACPHGGVWLPLNTMHSAALWCEKDGIQQQPQATYDSAAEMVQFQKQAKLHQSVSNSLRCAAMSFGRSQVQQCDWWACPVDTAARDQGALRSSATSPIMAVARQLKEEMGPHGVVRLTGELRTQFNDTHPVPVGQPLYRSARCTTHLCNALPWAWLLHEQAAALSALQLSSFVQRAFSECVCKQAHLRNNALNKILDGDALLKNLKKPTRPGEACLFARFPTGITPASIFALFAYAEARTAVLMESREDAKSQQKRTERAVGLFNVAVWISQQTIPSRPSRCPAEHATYPVLPALPDAAHSNAAALCAHILNGCAGESVVRIGQTAAHPAGVPLDASALLFLIERRSEELRLYIQLPRPKTSSRYVAVLWWNAAASGGRAVVHGGAEAPHFLYTFVKLEGDASVSCAWRDIPPSPVLDLETIATNDWVSARDRVPYTHGKLALHLKAWTRMNPAAQAAGVVRMLLFPSTDNALDVIQRVTNHAHIAALPALPMLLGRLGDCRAVPPPTTPASALETLKARLAPGGGLLGTLQAALLRSTRLWTNTIEHLGQEQASTVLSVLEHGPWCGALTNRHAHGEARVWETPIIAGPAGTGKSTVLSVIAAVWRLAYPDSTTLFLTDGNTPNEALYAKLCQVGYDLDAALLAHRGVAQLDDRDVFAPVKFVSNSRAAETGQKTFIHPAVENGHTPAVVVMTVDYYIKQLFRSEKYGVDVLRRCSRVVVDEVQSTTDITVLAVFMQMAEMLRALWADRDPQTNPLCGVLAGDPTQLTGQTTHALHGGLRINLLQRLFTAAHTRGRFPSLFHILRCNHRTFSVDNIRLMNAIYKYAGSFGATADLADAACEDDGNASDDDGTATPGSTVPLPVTAVNASAAWRDMVVDMPPEVARHREWVANANLRNAAWDLPAYTFDHVGHGTEVHPGDALAHLSAKTKHMSWCNTEQCERALEHLHALCVWATQRAPVLSAEYAAHEGTSVAPAEPISVMLLSIYQGDTEYLGQKLAARVPVAERGVVRVTSRNVDEVGGDQADVVILVTTRTTRQANGRCDGSRFLTLPRIITMLTRHRHMLVVIGNAAWAKDLHENGFARMFAHLLVHNGLAAHVRATRWADFVREIASARARATRDDERAKQRGWASRGVSWDDAMRVWGSAHAARLVERAQGERLVDDGACACLRGPGASAMCDADHRTVLTVLSGSFPNFVRYASAHPHSNTFLACASYIHAGILHA